MVSKKDWGNAVWKFFHVLPLKINEKTCNPQIIKNLFQYIKNICRVLPCPVCANHATQLLSQINENKCLTKKGLKDTMYIFHNNVNKKNNTKLFAYENLKEYESHNLIQCYNQMISKLTNKNFSEMANNMSKKILISNFKKFLIEQIQNNNLFL
jgi:hypothetical protein